jgi:murein DD-endopeptidase MepM/ murein hydrolase activator NlpD
MRNRKQTFKWHVPPIGVEIIEFGRYLWGYFFARIYRIYVYFESGKGGLVDVLYQKRGKYARPFMHTGMVGLLFIGVTVGPQVLEAQEDALAGQNLPQAEVLGMTTADTYGMGMETLSSDAVMQYRGGEVLEHEVKDGETLSQIAEQYGLRVDTILWANGLDSEGAKIKAGQILKILPIDGVLHKVKKGETVYSIAKKYEGNPQAMVDYPFNIYANDETFALAVGQTILVPDGVMPEVKPVDPRTSLATVLTPDAGQVSALGAFVWPAQGGISQRYAFYHKAIDIANRGGGSILAADSGVVTVSGWLDNRGYGNRVMIDHGNGYQTLYAHLSKINVVVGQSVNRGDVIGMMGSTGRSTGTHLHFEIRAGGALQNPLNFLQ